MQRFSVVFEQRLAPALLPDSGSKIRVSPAPKIRALRPKTLPRPGRLQPAGRTGHSSRLRRGIGISCESADCDFRGWIFDDGRKFVP